VEVGRNVLVVSTVDDAESVVRRTLGDDIETVKVVVPAVRQGFLDWLANDEGAFSHAEAEATRLADALPGETVEAAAGEADVQLAIQDALAEFAADEVIVVIHPDDEAGLVERIATEGAERSVAGVPVRLEVARDGREAGPGRRDQRVDDR